MGEVLEFLKHHPTHFRSVVNKHQIQNTSTPTVWDEIEAAKTRPCKVYLKHEIQEYIDKFNPKPPVATNRNGTIRV